MVKLNLLILYIVQGYRLKISFSEWKEPQISITSVYRAQRYADKCFIPFVKLRLYFSDIRAWFIQIISLFAFLRIIRSLDSPRQSIIGWALALSLTSAKDTANSIASTLRISWTIYLAIIDYLLDKAGLVHILVELCSQIFLIYWVLMLKGFLIEDPFCLFDLENILRCGF